MREASRRPARQAHSQPLLAPSGGAGACTVPRTHGHEQRSAKDEADAAATWVCLKALVAEWERRYQDLKGGEELVVTDILNVDELYLGVDGIDLEKAGTITVAVQEMSRNFGESLLAKDRLPAELRFLDKALAIGTTTEVRKFALQDFCPAEKMEVEELRTRLRIFLAGFDTLSKNTFANLHQAAFDTYMCLAMSTPDEYNIYGDNIFKIDETGKASPADLWYSPYDVSGNNAYFSGLRKYLTRDPDEELIGIDEIVDEKEVEKTLDELTPEWLRSDESFLPRPMTDAWLGSLGGFVRVEPPPERTIDDDGDLYDDQSERVRRIIEEAVNDEEFTGSKVDGYFLPENVKDGRWTIFDDIDINATAGDAKK